MASKLSDLIKFRNDLIDFVNSLSGGPVLNEQIANATALLNDSNVPATDQLIGVITRQTEHRDQFQSIIDAYKKIIVNVDNEIDQTMDAIIQATPRLSKEELNEAIRTYPANLSVPENVISRLFYNSNCLYPGLILAPMTYNDIRLLVSSDPLYLTGPSVDQLKMLITGFPEQYQNRLGLYDDLEKLPMNQFSIVFVPNLFDRLPYLNVIDYLKTILRLLRPGGHVIFTLANCDHYKIAVQAESGGIKFSSQNKLKKDCQQLGYEFAEFLEDGVDFETYQLTSWAVFKKPGELKTTKRGQAQGLVNRK